MNEDNILYESAKKRVEKIRGFYNHLVIYLVVNILIIYFNGNYPNRGESIFQFHIFSTAIFWGIGLLAHAFNVFAIHLLWGKDWEERKIKELMDKEKNDKGYI